MKTSLFNSLGSNYSWRFMWRSAFGRGSTADYQQFKELLTRHYHGSVTLTYKGREALELALRLSGLPKNGAIGINGFTCYVVYQAVKNAGYQPVFIDVAPGQMHFGLSELKAASAKHNNLVGIIVQNTLGYPADLKALQPYCSKHQLTIIEDAAHSLGAVYESGDEVGTIGDLSMFSFSQDKPLDVVAGGALVDHRRATKNPKKPAFKPVAWWQLEVNRDYPLWTGLIRGSYAIGLGRVLHFILKKIGWLATPMGDAGPGLHAMSAKTACLALARWSDRESELKHRQAIAKIYEQHVPKSLQLIAEPLGQPSYLRFPLMSDRRASLIQYLKKSHIYIGDTWYDAPIAPKRYMSQTAYEHGMCPQAEKLADTIINLPTHSNVSREQAEYVAGKVKQWHESQ